MNNSLSICFLITIFLGLHPSATLHAAPSESSSQTEYLDLKTHPELAKQVKIKYQPPMFKYPTEAKIRRIQGTVIIDAYVSSSGKVVKAARKAGPPELVDVVIPYVMKFEFYPLIVDDLPKPFIFQFTVPFKLH